MSERRRYPPFISWLPFRLTGVAGSKIELSAVTLLTQNISKSGAWFLAPRRIEPGQSIEVEAILAGMGPGGKDVYMAAAGTRRKEGPCPARHSNLPACLDQSIMMLATSPIVF